MPLFQIEARDQTGKPRKTEIEASSREEAAAKAKAKGLFPTDIKEKKAAKSGKSEAPAAKAKAKTGGKGKFSINIGGVSVAAKTSFTRQLSTLQDAGLPILKSLQILSEQQKPGTKLRQVLMDVTADVEGGSSLSEAMAKHPRAFDRLYTKMIAAGEVGGVLDLILQRLADFMEKAQKLKRKIIGAMIYPSVVISVAVLIVTGIMVFIVPKFQEIFNSFNAKLPGLTMLLINTSSWIAGSLEDQLIPGWIVMIAVPAMIWGIFKAIRMSDAASAVLDSILLKVPVMGKLMRYTAIARFSRTLGTLIAAGVPILEAVLITKDTVGNAVFENALQKVHDSIREGESFAGPLRESKTVDSIVVNMIDVGEETGELDKMLVKIADNYDEDVDVAVNALVSTLEPLMVVFLGSAVGTIVVALFMPLVTLIQAAQGGK